MTRFYDILGACERSGQNFRQQKGIDIQAIGVREVTTLADYFVIAAGGSGTQVKALADEVEFQLKQLGISP